MSSAEWAATSTTTVKAFQRKVPSRKPFPDHLPRERVVIAAPTSCGCCGSDRLSKLGEDVTETLEATAHESVVEAERCYFCHDAPCMHA